MEISNLFEKLVVEDDSGSKIACKIDSNVKSTQTLTQTTRSKETLKTQSSASMQNQLMSKKKKVVKQRKQEENPEKLGVCPNCNHQKHNHNCVTKDRLLGKLEGKREKKEEKQVDIKTNIADVNKNTKKKKADLKAAVASIDILAKLIEGPKEEPKVDNKPKKKVDNQKKSNEGKIAKKFALLKTLDDDLVKVGIDIKKSENQLNQLNGSSGKKSNKIATVQQDLKVLINRRAALESEAKNAFNSIRDIKSGVDLVKECEKFVAVQLLLSQAEPQASHVVLKPAVKPAVESKKGTHANNVQVIMTIHPNDETELYTFADGKLVQVKLILDAPIKAELLVHLNLSSRTSEANKENFKIPEIPPPRVTITPIINSTNPFIPGFNQKQSALSQQHFNNVAPPPGFSKVAPVAPPAVFSLDNGMYTIRNPAFQTTLPHIPEDNLQMRDMNSGLQLNVRFFIFQSDILF